MSDSIYQFLFTKLQQQLADKDSDPAWLDLVIPKLSSQIYSSSLPDPIKNTADAALAVIEDNKTSIVELGQYGLTLLLLQISSGRNQDAIETYIRALSNPDDLIALMNSGTNGVIKAKQRLDEMQAAALQLIGTIGIEVAKTLLPFLLSML